MKRSIGLLWVSAALFFLTVTQAAAVGFTVSYSGTNNTGMFFTRPGGGSPPTGLSSGEFGYDLQPFIVSSGGTFSLYSTQDYDGYLHLYSQNFNPSSPLTNVLAGNDDYNDTRHSLITIDLSPGVQYYLVTSSYSAGTFGTFTNDIGGPSLAVLSALLPNGADTQPLASMPEISFQLTRQYTQSLQQRLRLLGGGVYALNDQQRVLLAEAATVMNDAGPVASVRAGEGDGSGMWIKPFVMNGEQSKTSSHVGYEADQKGLSIGYDRRFGNNLVAGVFVGTAEGDVKFNGTNADSDVNSVFAGLYGGYVAEKMYIDASLSWTGSEHDTTRTFFGSLLTSDHDSDEFSAYAGAGYTVGEFAGMAVIPTASLQYSYYDADGFTESGPFGALEVDDYDTDSLQSRLGVRMTGRWKSGDSTYIPELRAAWGHEFGETEHELDARFDGDPVSNTFDVKGIEYDNDSFHFGAGLTAFLGQGYVLYADGNLEYRDNFDGWDMSAGFRYQF